MEILTENHAHFSTFRVRERVLKLFDNYLTRSFISLKKFDLFNSCNDNKTESNAHPCEHASQACIDRQVLSQQIFGFVLCFYFSLQAISPTGLRSVCVRALSVCENKVSFYRWKTIYRNVLTSRQPDNHTQFHPTEQNPMNEKLEHFCGLFILRWSDVMCFIYMDNLHQWICLFPWCSFVNFTVAFRGTAEFRFGMESDKSLKLSTHIFNSPIKHVKHRSKHASSTPYPLLKRSIRRIHSKCNRIIFTGKRRRQG